LKSLFGINLARLVVGFSQWQLKRNIRPIFVRLGWKNWRWKGFSPSSSCFLCYSFHKCFLLVHSSSYLSSSSYDFIYYQGL